MKNIKNVLAALFFTILIGSPLIAVICVTYAESDTTEYCGTVIRMYDTPPNYRVEATKHVVFYSRKLNRNIDAEVSNQVYANTEVNERICVELNRYEVND